MSKICFIALFVLLTVTAITARSTDSKRIARAPSGCTHETQQGDPCESGLDCRCGNYEMECAFINKLTSQCQVYAPQIVAVVMIEEDTKYDNILPIEDVKPINDS